MENKINMATVIMIFLIGVYLIGSIFDHNKKKQKIPFNTYEIVCERDLKTRLFQIFIPENTNDYEREQLFRDFCNSTEDDETWNSGYNEKGE